MSLRWKIPELQQNFVDPNGVNQTMMQQSFQNNNAAQAAAQQMQGYRPTGTDQDVLNAGGQGGYRGLAPRGQQEQASYNQNRQKILGIQQEITNLEGQLQQIDAQIAAIDKDMGGLTPEEAKIAAKRASVGDMSAYDNMVARRNNGLSSAKTAMDGIANKLYEAEKLTYGLGVKNDDDRAAARNQIEVALRQAEEAAQKTGGKLPDNYYRLQAKLAEADQRDSELQNAREYANTFWSKEKDGSLSDVDIASAKEFIAKNPNSSETEKIREAVDKYEKKTGEAKAAEQRAQNAAYLLFKDLKDMNAADADRYYNSLSDKQKKNLKKYFKRDEKTKVWSKK